jgi:hypothetical protein
MTRDGGGHIAIVVGRDQNGNLMCCGGNQSDAVTISAFDRCCRKSLENLCEQ